MHGKLPTWLRGMLLLLACTAIAAAQEAGAETSGHQNLGIWKLTNTAIFVVLLGYAIAKYSPRFFNARSADIQKAIRDATGLKMDADLRYSEIDRKLANLAGEVKKLRDQAAIELEREHTKLRHETEVEMEHMRRSASAEIDALREEGARKVRRHTAELALDLAERRIHDRFAVGEPDYFLQDFTRLVEQGKNR